MAINRFTPSVKLYGVFEEIVESSSDCTFIIHQSGKILYANNQAKILLGYTEDVELDGLEIWDLYPVSESHFMQNVAFRCARQMNQWKGDGILFTRKGNTIYVRQSLQYHKRSHDSVYFSLRIHDITEKKYKEDKREYYLNTLYKLSQAHPVYSGDFEETVALITKTAVETLGLDKASLWMYQEGKDIFQQTFAYDAKTGASEGAECISCKEHPQFKQTFEEQRIWVFHKINEDIRIAQYAKDYFNKYNIHSLIVVQFRAEGKFKGGLCCSFVDRYHTWTPREQDFISSLTDLLALCLEAQERKKAEQRTKQILKEHQLLNEQLLQREKELQHHLQEAVALKEKLAVNQEHYLSIAEVLPDLLFVIDSQGKFLEAYASEEISYYQKEQDFLGKKIDDIFPKPLSKKLNNTVQLASQSDEIQTVEYALRKPHSGELEWYEARVKKLKKSKYGENCLVATTRNVTEHKLKNLHLKKITQDLVSKNKDLEQFAYITSHDLRAPLANIQGLVNLIDADELNPDNQQLFSLLNTATENLDSVIKDINLILELKNDVKEVREWVSLNSLIQKVKESLKGQIQSTQASILTDFESIDEFFTIKSYVRSILYNLINNAIKYRQPDVPPVITIRTKKLTHNIFCLYISDNGLGIDLELHQKKLFGLYKRFHTHVGGKGLGLYLVKSQVDAIHGKISVESSLNQGTIFKICIPLSTEKKSIHEELTGTKC
ncbi:PAS domain S-box protein [Rapidithrix thailandica]|uniref:histidine kinase n=1 Tax=Rapidithrix thailandica TaxID=413964 RepID=A0AAW9S9E2_9BACT